MEDPRANDLVIITGASKGVGRATVIALIRQHGAQVLAISRDGAALGTLMDECRGGPGTLEAVAIDLSAPNCADEVRSAVAGRKVRALVHNAGHLLSRRMGEHTPADLGHLFHVNVIAPLLMSQTLADALAGDPPGHIVHIGSMGGFQDSVKFPGLVGYSASKAALACVAQCLAEEFKERGIRSNCLALGSVDTDMLRAAFPGFRSPTTAGEMGAFVAEFALHGHKLFNGKVLPVASTTP
ncbi:MAG: SDR family oxidoreductase [Flavobacteriales bacterium]|nr:SDR family oxidoreductase [Flavobacteriales bacterium]